jgi:hypothetical protein
MDDTISDALTNANSLVKDGQLFEAKSLLEELVNSGYQRSLVLSSLGEICRNLNMNAMAKQYLDLAIQLASFEKDEHVLVEAKASLAKLYIQEANAHLNALPIAAQWEELRAELNFDTSNCLPKESFQLLILGNCPPDARCGANQRWTPFGCRAC